MTNFVYILSSDPATNKEFSEMLGSGTKQYMTHSGEHGTILEADHAQSHVKGRALLLPDELNRLKEGEIIIKIDRHFPIRTIRTPYYKLGLPVVRIENMGISLIQNSSPLLMPYEDPINGDEDPDAYDFSTSSRNDFKEAPKELTTTAGQNHDELGVLMKTINLSPAFAVALDAGNYEKALAIERELCDFGSLSKRETTVLQKLIDTEMCEATAATRSTTAINKENIYKNHLKELPSAKQGRL
jgi:hypothetical protein